MAGSGELAVYPATRHRANALRIRELRVARAESLSEPLFGQCFCKST